MAAVVALSPVFAAAASLSPGLYDVVDYDGNRSIWTPNGGDNPNGDAFVKGKGGTTVSALWSFDNVLFDYDGATATMTGRAVNTNQSSLFFDINLSFTKRAGPGGNGPFCQFDWSGGACDGGDPVDTSMWTFFDLDNGGTFTGGAGSAMDGLIYDITDKSGHKPQAGIGAGALPGQENILSFSFWFDWDLRNPGDRNLHDPNFKFKKNGHGDVNANLVPTPLPAAAWLLIAGLGGLAFAGRRKTT